MKTAFLWTSFDGAGLRHLCLSWLSSILYSAFLSLELSLTILQSYMNCLMPSIMHTSFLTTRNVFWPFTHYLWLYLVVSALLLIWFSLPFMESKQFLTSPWVDRSKPRTHNNHLHNSFPTTKCSPDLSRTRDLRLKKLLTSGYWTKRSVRRGWRSSIKLALTSKHQKDPPLKVSFLKMTLKAMETVFESHNWPLVVRKDSICLI